MYTNSRDLIAELRRQAAMRNATWPCVLLKHMMPLLDEHERLLALAEATDELMAVAGPLIWDNSEYFRAADKCARLLRHNKQ